MDLSLGFLFCSIDLKIWNASRICVSSLRRGHANLLCIVPILVYVLPKQALHSVFNLKYVFFISGTGNEGVQEMGLTENPKTWKI